MAKVEKKERKERKERKEKEIVFKHRDGIIKFFPKSNEVEIESNTAFQRENENKEPFKGRIKINPERVFEAYKLTRQAVEGQDIEAGKIIFFKNTFKRIPYFTIGKPAKVSEGFIKKKGVFTIFAEDIKRNMASRFILNLNDLISIIGFFKQIPMRFKIADLILERRNNRFLVINPFYEDIENTDIERLKITLKQFLSGKEDIIPVYLGDAAAIFKKDDKLILRTDIEDIEITTDLAKDLWMFIN